MALLDREKERANTLQHSKQRKAAWPIDQGTNGRSPYRRQIKGRRMMKFATTRAYADPEVAARKLIEIANSVEAVQDGRIHIELINGPMIFTPAEYSAGLKLAIERAWLTLGRSGTYVKFAQAGGELHDGQVPSLR